MSSNLQKHICWFHPPQAHCRMVGCVHEAGCPPPFVGSKHHSSHIDGPSHRSHIDSHTWMDGVWELCCSMMHIPSRNENTNYEWCYLCFRTPCVRRKQTCWLLGRKPKKLRALAVQGRVLGMISIDCWLFTFLPLQNHSWALSFLLLWGAIPSSTALISNFIWKSR